MTLTVLLLAVIATPVQGEEPPLTNNDVVTLTRSGLPAAVILAKIETSATAFDASVDALVALAEAGVDPEVVRVMTMAAAGLPADRPEIVAPEVRREAELGDLDLPVAGACGGGLAFLLESGGLSGLERHEVEGTVDVDTRLPGVRSAARTGQRRPTFIFCIPDAALDSASVYGLSGFSLIRFRAEGGERLGVEAVGEWSRRRDEVATGVFRVESDGELAPGEYAMHIFRGDAVWAFGVDE